MLGYRQEYNEWYIREGELTINLAKITIDLGKARATIIATLKWNRLRWRAVFIAVQPWKGAPGKTDLTNCEEIRASGSLRYYFSVLGSILFSQSSPQPPSPPPPAQIRSSSALEILALHHYIYKCHYSWIPKIPLLFSFYFAGSISTWVILKGINVTNWWSKSANPNHRILFLLSPNCFSAVSVLCVRKVIHNFFHLICGIICCHQDFCC